MNISSTTSANEVGASFVCSVVNGSYFIMSISSTTTTATYIDYLSVDVVFFNTLFFARQNFSFFRSGIVTGTNGSTITYTDPGVVYSSTSMAGLYSFKAKGTFTFGNSYQEPNDLIISRPNNTGDVFVVYYWLLQTYYCDFTTPYLYQNLCYDVCPPGTNPDDTTLTCIACLNYCYSCAPTAITLCLSCNPSDYR
jgi:hypothetical protein